MLKAILLSMLFIYSCKENSGPIDDLYLKVQGDWIYYNTSEKWEESIFLSIKDSLLFYGEHIDSFETFSISLDSTKFIFCLNYNSERNYKLCFSKITSKYLWTLDETSNKDIPKFINTNDYYNDMIMLKGIEVRFMNDYRGLLDWGLSFDDNSKCFIKINKLRTSKYIRNPFNLPVGIYQTDFNKSDFEFFQEKLRRVPFDKLNNIHLSEDYKHNLGGLSSDNEHDIALIFLDIHFSYVNSQEIKTISFISSGFQCIPSYLGVFINYLNKINNYVSLNADTTSFSNFKFYSKEFIHSNKRIFFPYENFKPSDIDKSP